jgi:repressor LexA
MPRTPYDYTPILTFITAYTLDNGYPPTLREIGAACHLTKTAVWYHLDRLDQMGIIIKQPGKIRGINVNSIL